MFMVADSLAAGLPDNSGAFSAPVYSASTGKAPLLMLLSLRKYFFRNTFLRISFRHH